jgi:hypothetical protein
MGKHFGSKVRNRSVVEEGGVRGAQYLKASFVGE